MKDAHKRWHLVYTKARHETVAQLNLQRQGFDTYLPLLQMQKRQRNLYQIVTEPLFPRYLFISLNPKIDDWSKIRSTRGCISLVRFGELPASVPDSLIQKLKLSEMSRVANEIEPGFKSGDKVQIIDGLLAGYEGIVTSKNNQQRVTLLLSIAQTHTSSINLPIHQIEAI